MTKSVLRLYGQPSHTRTDEAFAGDAQTSPVSPEDIDLHTPSSPARSYLPQIARQDGAKVCWKLQPFASIVYA
jgi:hypothetical protein